MSRSVAEVAGVEFVGGTDLGRGRDRRMERGRDGRCKSVWGHAARALSEQTGAAQVRRKGSRRLILIRPDRRTDDL
jgi:hypothetical protein